MNCAAAMAQRSYTYGNHGVQPKHYRPKSLGEAKRLIAEIFAKQGTDGWDERSQRKYMETKGVEPKPVEDLDVEEARIIVAALEAAHMVIFNQ